MIVVSAIPSIDLNNDNYYNYPLPALLMTFVYFHTEIGRFQSTSFDSAVIPKSFLSHTYYLKINDVS